MSDAHLYDPQRVAHQPGNANGRVLLSEGKRGMECETTSGILHMRQRGLQCVDRTLTENGPNKQVGWIWRCRVVD